MYLCQKEFNMINKQSLSQTIDYVRFPLIILVLFIHTGIEQFSAEYSYSGFNFVRHFVTDEFACLGVPLFFFISGFLFFYNCEFSFDVYKQKLKSRVKSLLIPYIIWNLAYVILKFLSESFTSVHVESTMVKDYGLLDWIQVFWDAREGNPINGPLWFVRDLMVMTLLSYVFHYLIRKLDFIFPFFLLLLWIYDAPCLHPFSWQWAFFVLGAYFSITQKDFIYTETRVLVYMTLMYFALTLYSTYCGADFYLHKWDRAFGIFCVFGWVYKGIECGYLSVNKFLAKSSFFIFCFHYLFEERITMTLMNKLAPVSEVVMLVIYLSVPAIVVLVSLGVYYILTKFMPGLSAILLGSRK